MSQTSANYPLDNNDPADLPRCPMERLADRFCDAPRPKWMSCYANRGADACCYFTIEGCVSDPEQIDDLINFLARVKG